MTLDRVISEKLASQYYDGEMKQVIIDGKVKRVPDHTAPRRLEKVTDYLGQQQIVEIGTYHALYDIQFKMKDSSSFISLCQALQEEKALPPEYRQLENAVKDYITQYRCNNTYCNYSTPVVL